MGPLRMASAPAGWIDAVSFDPVKATPDRAGRRAAPAHAAPPPGRKCSTSTGTPASMQQPTAAKPISGVCPAGLATAALPEASAAAICPVKIASGKFHGADAGKNPRPCSDSSFRSPVGPGIDHAALEVGAGLRGIVAQEVNCLAQIGNGIVARTCRLADDSPKSRARSCSKAGRLSRIAPRAAPACLSQSCPPAGQATEPVPHLRHRFRSPAPPAATVMGEVDGLHRLPRPVAANSAWSSRGFLPQRAA